MRLINMPPWCAVLLYFLIDVPLLVLSISLGNMELISISAVVVLINTVLIVCYFVKKKKYKAASSQLNKEIRKYRSPNNQTYVTHSKKGVLETYEEIILSDLYDISLVELAYFNNPACHGVSYRKSTSYKITYDKLSKKSKRKYAFNRWVNSPFSRYLIFEFLFFVSRIKREKMVKLNINNLIENYHFNAYFKKHRQSIINDQISPE